MPNNVPASKSEIFWAFTRLALQGFGGVLPVAQRELVERHRWYTKEEFVEEWGVAQVMPGPNVINLAIIFGARHFGLLGALSAIAGMLVFPIVVIIGIAIVYHRVGDMPVATGALRGMGAVAAGLIAGTSLKMATVLKQHPLGIPVVSLIAAVCFVMIALLRVSLVPMLFTLGVLAIYLTYRKVR